MDEEAKASFDAYKRIRIRKTPWWEKFLALKMWSGIAAPLLFLAVMYELRCDRNLLSFFKKKELILTSEQMAEYYALKNKAQDLSIKKSKIDSYIYRLNRYKDKEQRKSFGYSDDDYDLWRSEYLKLVRQFNETLEKVSYNRRLNLMPVLADSQEMPKGMEPLPLNFKPYVIMAEQDSVYESGYESITK